MPAAASKSAKHWRQDRTLFFAWAQANGYQPGLQLDRRDNDRGYNPENCRWVPAYVNARNRATTKLTARHYVREIRVQLRAAPKGRPIPPSSQAVRRAVRGQSHHCRRHSFRTPLARGYVVRVLGCDPGTVGAIAILDGTDVLLLEDLPVHQIGTSGRKTTRPEIDLHQLHTMIAAHAPYTHAIIEKVGAMPKQGTQHVPLRLCDRRSHRAAGGPGSAADGGRAQGLATSPRHRPGA